MFEITPRNRVTFSSLNKEIPMLIHKAIFSLVLAFGLANHALADKIHIAVAANFTAAMKEISAQFEQQTGHKLLVSYGSTGKLYAQIINNAPFEIFLAADQKRPQLLHEKDKLGEKPATYAIGKLVLWSRDSQRDVSEAALKAGNFKKIALANPKTAPYGAAAVQIMEHLQVAKTLRKKWIVGDTVAQTYQFIATGNVELGFVALAQIVLDESGAHWDVPQDYYTPIHQDAMLLKRGAENPAARAFMDYLYSDAAKTIIDKFGYGTTQ